MHHTKSSLAKSCSQLETLHTTGLAPFTWTLALALSSVNGGTIFGGAVLTPAAASLEGPQSICQMGKWLDSWNPARTFDPARLARAE